MGTQNILSEGRTSMICTTCPELFGRRWILHFSKNWITTAPMGVDCGILWYTAQRTACTSSDPATYVQDPAGSDLRLSGVWPSHPFKESVPGFILSRRMFFRRLLLRYTILCSRRFGSLLAFVVPPILHDEEDEHLDAS